jgi:SAM-dependent methyltransferase
MAIAPICGYVFDNDSAHASDHHAALAALLDPVTRERISDLIELWGASCLEVAAGGGSIAEWLAAEVGSDGQVVATDTKPDLIPLRPRLSVLRHDITTGTPGRGYDLVHARLLLNHLRQRRQVLHHLADALRPGGVLVTEDFWPMPAGDFVVCAPSPDDAAVLRRYHLAHLQVLEDHGNDRSWSRQALIAFMEEGLVDVRTTVSGGSWRGGGPGCQLLIAGIGQLQDELVRAGLTLADLDHVRVLLNDPTLVLHGHLLYSTSGQRPYTTDAPTEAGAALDSAAPGDAAGISPIANDRTTP